MQELCSVEASFGGWAVRLVGGQLVTTQRDEADAHEIADLVSFKRALDEGLALDAVLLRLPNARDELRDSEEELRNLSWSQLVANLKATEQQAEEEEEDVSAAAAAAAGEEEAAAAHSSSQVPSLQDVTAMAVEPSEFAEQQQHALPASTEPPQPQQHKVQQPASTGQQQGVGGGAAPAAGGAGAAQPPAAVHNNFSIPPKLLGCYRQPYKPSVLTVQVSLHNALGDKQKTTTFFGGCTVPEAAGMARDAIVVWERLRRGDPLHGRPYNFPLQLYTSNAGLMADLANCADVDSLKALIRRHFMEPAAQAAAAAAVAAAGAVVPALPPIGPTPGEKKAAKEAAAAAAVAAGAGASTPGAAAAAAAAAAGAGASTPGAAAAAAAAAVATGGGGGRRGSGTGTRNLWKLLAGGGGVSKVMPAKCEKVVYVSEMAWEALFGSQEAHPHLMLQHQPTAIFLPVDASHETTKGAYRLGRGWAHAAKVLRLRPGDTLVLKRADSGGVTRGDEAGLEGEAAGAAETAEAGSGKQQQQQQQQQEPPMLLVSVVHSIAPPDSSVLAPPGQAGVLLSGSSGVVASPLAGNKRSAEAAGLLRSPGGTAKQLCVDTMLAAASGRQQQQQQQQESQPAVKDEPTGQTEQQAQQAQPQQPQQQAPRIAVPPQPQGQQAQQQEQPAQPRAEQQRQQSMPPPQPPAQMQPGHGPSAEPTAMGVARAAAAATAAAAPMPLNAAATAAATTSAAPAVPSGADPYQLYCKMKPAVVASGLPAAARHAYFQAFMRLPAWQQCMHCEVTEMAAEGLHSQLRLFLENEAAAGAVALGQPSGQPPASTMIGGGASGYAGADRTSCL